MAEHSNNLERGTNGIHHPVTSPQHSQSFLVKVTNLFEEEATFFRVHLAAFTFIPLIFSGIFYAVNGRFRVSFLDSLFLCYSAMTVTGLSTVNLSTITALQQGLLYFLMAIGDITIVAWTMVLIRKRFFKNHCQYVIAKQKTMKPVESRTSFLRTISSPRSPFKLRHPAPRQEVTNYHASNSSDGQFDLVRPTPGATLTTTEEELQDSGIYTDDAGVFTDLPTFSSSPQSETFVTSPIPDLNLRSIPGVEFAASTTISPRVARNHPMLTLRDGRPGIRRGSTMLSNKAPEVPGVLDAQGSKYQGLGGFPGPGHLFKQVLKLAAPHAYRRFERSMTLPSQTTLQPSAVPWLNFSGLVVGRNSDFHTETLTDEQLEHVGGAEYQALNLLSWLVPTYFVGFQLVTLLLFMPWLSVVNTYDDVFESQPRMVSKVWFSVFQVMGAYTGGGLSLVDLGMVPFQSGYLMIFALGLVILAGNHALPIFLRFVIWTSSKLLSEDAELQEALSFLLDHPRRCFIYLFPSHQTWFLLICLVLFSGIEWVSFVVLNIGLPVYDSIPVGTRVVDGLFQGLAVRASGFAIVALSELAPALLFLYVVMMYIAVYPVALSIRSTNVYEERSLGVFEAPPDEEDEEPMELNQIPDGKERLGRYLGWHLRRQVSIDIWWLVWAVFLIAIIERGQLLDESKPWFDIFHILFDLVSAFGGIGLSLGFPDNNFSFVGAMSPLSKLIVIIIMVRGRHRGLPVAIDRAVLLPSELVVNQELGSNQKESKNEGSSNGQPPRPPHLLVP